MAFGLAVYSDQLPEPNARDGLPPGLELYTQQDINNALGFESPHILGIRGGALLFHLLQRFPKAAWYIEGDDDTFFGRHQLNQH